jgi:hypothetical protein
MENEQSLIRKLTDYRETPYYVDSCGHGGYLFSFTSVMDDERLDAYCFGGPGQLAKQSFCLRFGEEDSHYCSPGSIENIIHAARVDCKYKDLLDLLKEVGSIVFERSY